MTVERNTQYPSRTHRAVALEETGYFDDTPNVLKEMHIKRVWTIYVYRPYLHVHLCEFTPSYELVFVEPVFEFDEAYDVMSDEGRERAYDVWMSTTAPYEYVHVDEVEKLRTVEVGEFDTDQEAVGELAANIGLYEAELCFDAVESKEA